MELKNLGRADEAEKLARKAAELLEAAKRLENDQAGASEQELDKLRAHLKALIEKQRQVKEADGSEETLAQIQAEIAKARGELEQREIKRKQKPMAGGPQRDRAIAELEDAGRRIKHLRIAAEHLHEAGVHDLADQLAEQAADMEREAGKAKRRLAEENGPRPSPDHRGEPDLIGQIKGLREEVGRLRNELNELRRYVKERGER